MVRAHEFLSSCPSSFSPMGTKGGLWDFGEPEGYSKEHITWILGWHSLVCKGHSFSNSRTMLSTSIGTSWNTEHESDWLLIPVTQHIRSAPVSPSHLSRSEGCHCQPGEVGARHHVRVPPSPPLRVPPSVEAHSTPSVTSPTRNRRPSDSDHRVFGEG